MILFLVINYFYDLKFLIFKKIKAACRAKDLANKRIRRIMPGIRIITNAFIKIDDVMPGAD